MSGRVWEEAQKSEDLTVHGGNGEEKTRRGIKSEQPQSETSIIFTLMQIPQPIHSVSEIHAILHCDVTSMHSFPGERVLIHGTMISSINMLQGTEAVQ